MLNPRPPRGRLVAAGPAHSHRVLAPKPLRSNASWEEPPKPSCGAGASALASKSQQLREADGPVAAPLRGDGNRRASVGRETIFAEPFRGAHPSMKHSRRHSEGGRAPTTVVGLLSGPQGVVPTLAPLPGAAPAVAWTIEDAPGDMSQALAEAKRPSGVDAVPDIPSSGAAARATPRPPGITDFFTRRPAKPRQVLHHKHSRGAQRAEGGSAEALKHLKK